MTKENKKADAAWAKINELYGISMFKASEPIRTEHEVIKFPSPSLADASQYDGVPLGKITQFHGLEGSGKTFFAMLMVKQMQEQYPDGTAVWFDCEHSFNVEWAEDLGIDLTRLRVLEENNAGQVFSVLCGIPGKKDAKPKPGILDFAISNIENIKLVVLDSIASLIPPVEQDRSVDEQDIAALARFLPKALRVTAAKLAQANTAMICINQAREKIGEMVPTLSYPGGRAYRHFLSLTILFNNTNSKSSQIVDARGNKIGHKIICTVEKTRNGPNRHKAEIWLDFTSGMAKLGEEIALLGKAYDVVELASNNRVWVYNDHQITGKENFYEFLENNPNVANAILQDCKEAKKRGAHRTASLSEDSENDDVRTEGDDDE